MTSSSLSLHSEDKEASASTLLRFLPTFALLLLLAVFTFLVYGVVLVGAWGLCWREGLAIAV